MAEEQQRSLQPRKSADFTVGDLPRFIVDLSSNEFNPPSITDYVPAANPELNISWLDDLITTLIIGPEQRKLAVHEKLLLAKSPYFQRILDETGKEELGEIFLGDVDARLFSMLLRWMYGTAFGRVFRFALPDDDVTIHD